MGKPIRPGRNTRYRNRTLALLLGALVLAIAATSMLFWAQAL